MRERLRIGWPFCLDPLNNSCCSGADLYISDDGGVLVSSLGAIETETGVITPFNAECHRIVRQVDVVPLLLLEIKDTITAPIDIEDMDAHV